MVLAVLFVFGKEFVQVAFGLVELCDEVGIAVCGIGWTWTDNPLCWLCESRSSHKHTSLISYLIIIMFPVLLLEQVRGVGRLLKQEGEFRMKFYDRLSASP